MNWTFRITVVLPHNTTNNAFEIKSSNNIPGRGHSLPSQVPPRVGKGTLPPHTLSSPRRRHLDPCTYGARHLQPPFKNPGSATGMDRLKLLVWPSRGMKTLATSLCAQNLLVYRQRWRQRQVVPPVIEVTGVVSEHDAVDVRSKLRRFVYRTFVITSQVLGHLLHTLTLHLLWFQQLSLLSGCWYSSGRFHLSLTAFSETKDWDQSLT